MARRLRDPRIVTGLVLLLAAVVVSAVRLGAFRGTAGGAARSGPAPEFRGIASWLNSPPLTVAGLRGKVVLVDFWAYSCVNCVRTFPALRQLYARYRPFGLEIVGVHSPEFDFEKRETNVREAIRENQLPWPVALDNEMATWRAYRNRFWPHVYLIDAAGRIRFDHIGEGGDALIQDHLRGLLAEAGAALPQPVDFAETSFTPDLTPEIYAGSARGSLAGSLGNPEGYRSGVVDYAPVDEELVHDAGTAGVFFLEGRWRATPEYVEAAEDGARLRLPFYARDVFLVGAADPPAEVRLLLDGAPVSPASLGADAPEGNVRVGRADLYRLLAGKAAGTHELTLVCDAGFRLYTFTFG